MISPLKVSCVCHLLSLTQFTVAAGGHDFLAKKVDLSGARQVSSSAVEIMNDWLVVNNRHYSRKQAQDSGLGRIGQAVWPWLLAEPALINFHTNPAPEWLEDNVMQTTTLTISNDQLQQIDGSVEGGFGPLSGDGSISTNSTHNASYVLHGFTLSNVFKIKEWFNNNEQSELYQKYRDMYTHTEKPRIVTSVWVLALGDPEEASSCVSGNVTMKYNVPGPSAGFSVSGTGCGYRNWTFSPNAILAYEASYLKFEELFPDENPLNSFSDEFELSTHNRDRKCGNCFKNCKSNSSNCDAAKSKDRCDHYAKCVAFSHPLSLKSKNLWENSKPYCTRGALKACRIGENNFGPWEDYVSGIEDINSKKYDFLLTCAYETKRAEGNCKSLENCDFLNSYAAVSNSKGCRSRDTLHVQIRPLKASALGNGIAARDLAKDSVQNENDKTLCNDDNTPQKKFIQVKIEGNMHGLEACTAIRIKAFTDVPSDLYTTVYSQSESFHTDTVGVVVFKVPTFQKCNKQFKVNYLLLIATDCALSARLFG